MCLKRLLHVQQNVGEILARKGIQLRKFEMFADQLQLSALREISLVEEMHNAGVVDMQFLYMGKYRHFDALRLVI